MAVRSSNFSATRSSRRGKGSSYRQSAGTEEASETVYNAGEEAELRERLRALGYIE